MRPARAEVHSLDALEAIIRSVRAGLVTFDGCPQAGKSTAYIHICERLGITRLEVDDYLVPNRGEYVKALRASDLLRTLQDAHSPLDLRDPELVTDAIGGCTFRFETVQITDIGPPVADD
ncbi:hypothetical protein DIE12_34415 [Burkholderia sp. Bp9015]|nr:hypothetical protein DIE12_34415 [Burkholderia sp. Bp9015]